MQDGPCEVCLILELPLHGLPSHVLNLRSLLITSLKVAPEQEKDIINAAKAKISYQVPEYFHLDAPFGLGARYSETTVLSQTVKSAVALWIRQNMSTYLQFNRKKDSPMDSTKKQNKGEAGTCLANLEQFLNIRRILEDFEDFAILADVIDILSNEVQGPTMTAVIDTVNHYFDVFNAIGAADDIFRKLYRRVEKPHGAEVIEKASLESLIDLACRLSNTTCEVQRLRHDILALVPRLSAAAFSPISDSMVEAVQSTEPTFADDMDQMLAGGTTMDKQTLTRVFGTIIGHLETSFEVSSQSSVRFSQLLARLRRFGPKIFDSLLKDWLQKWLRSDLRTKPWIILSPMICSRAVPLKVVLDSTMNLLSIEGHRNDRAILALEILDIVIMASSAHMPAVDYRVYRLVDQLHHLVRISSASITALLNFVVETCGATETALRARAQARVKNFWVTNLIQTLVLQQPSIQSGSSSASPNTDLHEAFYGLLDQEQFPKSTYTDRYSRILSLINKVSDFNVPLVQLELRTILSKDGCLENAEDAVSNIFVERASILTDGQVELLACLVSELPLRQAASVREKAEAEVIAMCATDGTWMCQDSKARVDGLAAIIEAAAFSVSNVETSQILDQVADRLSTICFSPHLYNLDKLQHNQDKIRLDRVCQSFHVLISLLIVHQSTIQDSRFSQSALFQILISLGRLLIHPFLAFHPTLPSYVFDTLALLSDSLSDDARKRCVRTLRDPFYSQDSRLRFAFGYPKEFDSEWLQLVTKSSINADATSDATSRQPYPLRRWEMMQDATPASTDNDTSLSLTLFGARKSVL